MITQQIIPGNEDWDAIKVWTCSSIGYAELTQGDNLVTVDRQQVPMLVEALQRLLAAGG